MANAKRCDRCGQLFDPYNIGKRKFVRFRNPAFEDEEAVLHNKVAHYLLNKDGADAIVDLCPDCTEDFECFMDNYPLAIRTDVNEKNNIDVSTINLDDYAPYFERAGIDAVTHMPKPR